MNQVIDRPLTDRLVSTTTIAELLDLSATHVRDKVTKRKDFPKPVWIGGVRRWRLHEVMSWVEAQQ